MCCMALNLRLLECCNQVRLESKIVESENQCNFLGMFVGNKLESTNHSDSVAEKFSKSIRVSYRIKEFVPQSSLINLHSRFVFPYVNYIFSIRAGTYDIHTDQVIRLKKRALLITCTKSFREDTNEFFYQVQYSQIQ